ncbi:MAG: carbohydrate kinase [Devosiaceae bacterium]|nr:carbohydrate kinase [Devosiaceae bacterium]
MIICCGEALIDFLPAKTLDGASAFQPHTGGSIYNVAIAIGRLGRNVGYLGGISKDFFGQMLLDGLKSSNVDLGLVAVSERPTTLAFVKLINGQAQYAFVDEGSAGRMIVPEQFADLPKTVTAMHFGSFSLINDPGASTYEKLAKNNSENLVISIDPNIRPTLVKDRASYLQRLERMIALADIIKISDEDLRWIYPDANENLSSEELVAKKWIEQGAKLVVITRGKDGASAWTSRHKVFQPAIEAKFCDSVGAGDTFSAGILASLDAGQLLNKSKLADISLKDLEYSMNYAAKAAAITVSRAGANPPWEKEL